MIAWLLLQTIKGSLLVHDWVYVTLCATREDRTLFRDYRKLHGRGMPWLQRHKIVALGAARHGALGRNRPSVDS